MNGIFLFFILCIEKNEYFNTNKSSKEISELSEVVNYTYGWEVEEERLVRIEDSNGDKYFYEGDSERLVRKEYYKAEKEI